MYSGPSDPKLRAHLCVWTSDNDGKSWAAPKTVWEGPAAYSDLVRTISSAGVAGIGILYENGDATFADRISFSFLPASWVGGV